MPTRSGLAATHTRDVYYGYDLLGGLTYANFDSPTGEGLSFTYDALGQLVSATTNLDSQSRTLAYQYDAAGRRTRITHPDNAWWTHEWDNLGRLTKIKDQAGTALVSNIFWAGGQLRRSSRDSSAPDVNFHYDPGMRLDELFTNHPVGTYDVTHSWTLNPAGQAADESTSNNIFASHALPTTTLDYTANGLNQYTQVGTNTYSYDTGGNLTSDGSTTFTYDTENRLVSASGGNSATLRYDPFGRLYEVTDSGNNKTRFHYDRDAPVKAVVRLIRPKRRPSIRIIVRRRGFFPRPKLSVSHCRCGGRRTNRTRHANKCRCDHRRSEQYKAPHNHAQPITHIQPPAKHQ